MGRIRIVKTDSLTGKPLAGAVFTVTRLSGPASDHAADVGKVVRHPDNQCTGHRGNGPAPLGEYKITETGVQDGYLDAGYTANAGSNERGTSMICFTKRFVFLGLCAILFFGLIAILMLPMTARAVTTGDAATVTLNVTNTPVRGDVLLEKTGLQLVRFEDEQDAYGNTVMRPVFQNGYLAGAVFELRAAEDIVGKEGSVFYRKDELIETLTTSKTGPVKSRVLPLGKYSLTEISAPDGYVLGCHAASLHAGRCGSADRAGRGQGVRRQYLSAGARHPAQAEGKTAADRNRGRHDSSDCETVPGEGFVFGLFNRDVITYGDSQSCREHPDGHRATDSQGNLTFSGLYPHGDYYIKELSVPDGWLLSAQTYPVTLTPNHKASGENVITCIWISRFSTA